MEKNIINHLLKVAKKIVAGNPEKEVERLLQAILKNNYFANKVFSVGGYVRDEMLGLDSKDLDIVVEEDGGSEKFADVLKRQFSKDVSNPYELGAGYPIWHLSFKDDVEYMGDEFNVKGAELDIADTQKESFPDPNSRQRVTTYGSKEKDVERRDFTVNSLMKNLTNGELLDLSGYGVEDLEKGLIRVNPEIGGDRIFNDDPLRMIRAARFACKYDWDIEDETMESAKQNADRINIVSGERIRDELMKMAQYGKLAQGVEKMDDLGVLEHVLPEIKNLQNVEHGTREGVHEEGNVWNHVMLVTKNAKPDIKQQFAALFHDIGKQNTREVDEETGKVSFHDHEKESADMADNIMRRLKFSSKQREKIKDLVGNHMLTHDIWRNGASSKSLRKMMRKLGDNLEDVLDLSEADTKGNLPVDNYMPEMRDKLEDIKKIPIKKKPVLNGKEIMDLLNISEGSEVGDAIKLVKEYEDDYASRGETLTKDDAKRLLVKDRIKDLTKEKSSLKKKENFYRENPDKPGAKMRIYDTSKGRKYKYKDQYNLEEY